MRDEQFERLFDEHAQSLFGFLVYRTGDRSLAEEVVSEAFERAFRVRHRYDRSKASESTWLHSIALNCLRDRIRRQAAEGRALERMDEPAADPEAAFEQVEGRASLARALEQLSDEEREAIALRFGADLTVPEIARVVREPLTTVEGRVYRALRKLREVMPPDGFR